MTELTLRAEHSFVAEILTRLTQVTNEALLAGELETLRLFVTHHNQPVKPFPTDAIREFVTRRTSDSNNVTELRALVVSDGRDLPWLESRINNVEYEGLYEEVGATSALGYYIHIQDFSEYDEDVFETEGEDVGYDPFFDEAYGDPMEVLLMDLF